MPLLLVVRMPLLDEASDPEVITGERKRGAQQSGEEREDAGDDSAPTADVTV